MPAKSAERRVDAGRAAPPRIVDCVTSALPLPSQFYDIWPTPAAVSPEQSLVTAVLWEAAHDVEKWRFAKRRREQWLYWDAYAWISSDDRSWNFSFVNLCETIGLTVAAVREQLLGEMMPAAAPAVEAALGRAA